MCTCCKWEIAGAVDVSENRLKAGSATVARDNGGWRDIVPALCLAALGLTGLVVATLGTNAVPGQYLVVMSPRVPAGAVMDMVYRAHGGVLGFGGLPGVTIATSDDPSFAEAIRAEGALLVIRSPRFLGCFVPTQGETS